MPLLPSPCSRASRVSSHPWHLQPGAQPWLWAYPPCPALSHLVSWGTLGSPSGPPCFLRQSRRREGGGWHGASMLSPGVGLGAPPAPPPNSREPWRPGLRCRAARSFQQHPRSCIFVEALAQGLQWSLGKQAWVLHTREVGVPALAGPFLGSLRLGPSTC